MQGDWQLSEQKPDNFTMIVFYRGYHCPVCIKYLAELDKLVADFEANGVKVIAVSGDDAGRTEQTQEAAKLQYVPMAYGLSKEQSQAWGLHRSKGKGKTSTGVEEPEEFSEPGLFIIKPDHTLYWASISTMPFARPNFTEILGAVKWVVANDYPARGELS